MPARLSIVDDFAQLDGVNALLIIGRPERLVETDVLALLPDTVDEKAWRTMVRRSDPGDHGRVATTWTNGSPTRVSAGVLPDVCSRHNSPARAWAIPGMVQAAGQKGHVGIVLAVEEPEFAAASVLAVARALPTYTSSSNPVEREVKVLIQPRAGSVADVQRLGIAADAVRLAAHLTDQPPNVLNCNAFVDRAQEVAQETGSDIRVFRRADMLEHGLMGIYGVGAAAAQEPAMIVLDSPGPATGDAVAWVGKGIVYDTGGLSIKSKTGMPGMKTDMAGAAAVLAAFGAAVKLGVSHPLTAVLCVAENAVGPNAMRPDDIITLFSGRSVEVNNTDAEGRLVLSDGVAWVARNRQPRRIVDLATLTGAQSVSTGKRHAALYCNHEELEQAALTAGRFSGDLVHPLPYSPELFRREFSSVVADMRNSVKDRSNAQSSCAGQFIGNHLFATGYEHGWLHVDMAGPSVSGQRGTGYGVGLLLALHQLL